MPIKWTADKDQLMLLKLLETHEVRVDAAKIAAAWPSDQGESPSARAITERLAKIRKTVQAGGSASPSKAPSTPVKISPTKRANTSKVASASKRTTKTSKVKKEDADSDDVDEDEIDGLDTGNIIKEEEEPSINGSPTRRSARAAPKKIDYAQLAGEGGGSGEDGEDGEETAGETADTGSNFGQTAGDDD